MDEALKPCPFCGGSWVVTHRPANGSQPHISCKECNASGPLTAGMTEAQWRAAWNTRADAAPTPKADEVKAVARVVAPMMEGGREFDQMPKDRRELKIWRASGMCSTNDATQDDAIELSQAAIAALDAARGDPVARVVEWLREKAGPLPFKIWQREDYSGEHREWSETWTLPQGAQVFLDLADKIDRGEPFNG